MKDEHRNKLNMIGDGDIVELTTQPKCCECVKCGPRFKGDAFCRNTSCPCHTQPNKGNQIPYRSDVKKDGWPQVIQSTNMLANAVRQGKWIESFNQEFGKMIIGTLSGDKSSPVFVNNELEVPRLKSFIAKEKEESYQEGKKEGAAFKAGWEDMGNQLILQGIETYKKELAAKVGELKVKNLEGSMFYGYNTAINDVLALLQDKEIKR